MTPNDTTRNDTTQDHTLTLHLWKGGIGHMAVVLQAPGEEAIVYGFGPRGTVHLPDGKGGQVEMKSSPKRFHGPGTMNRDEDEQAILNPKPGKPLPTNPSEPIKLSKEQYDAFRNYAERKKIAPGSYNAVGSNCVDFVVDGMKEAGIESVNPMSKFSPRALSEGGAAAWMYYDRAHKLLPPSIHDGEINRPWEDFRLPEKDGTDAQAPATPAAPDSEKKSETDDPAVSGFVAQASRPPARGLEMILAKQPAEWTEKEVATVRTSPAAESPTDPEFNAINDRVRDWYVHHYGTDKVRFDATGRMIDPTYKVTPPASESPTRDRDGADLTGSVAGIAERIARAAGADGLGEAVRALQKGINLRETGTGSPLPGRVLREDGVFGPKTHAALWRTTARLGKGRMEEAIALGRFMDHAEKAENGWARDEVGKAAHESFGSLFARDPGDHSPEDHGEKPWGLAVQATVNDLNGEAEAKLPRLKEDGWLGPKSQLGFRDTVRAVGSDRFLRHLSRNLGFRHDD